MNLDPMAMNQMILQFQMMMNNMNNNVPNQSPNYPLMQNFMNYGYYKRKNQDPLNDSNLNQTEKNLLIFFKCISDFDKTINYNGTKIYINYYNLEKIELYLDLRLQVKYLISIIFGLIFPNSNQRKYYIREEKNKTTQEIIENPLMFYESESLYKNIMFLEFNNIDLNKISEKTGNEIGLKEGDEIFLKLKKENYNELEAIKLDYSYIHIDVDNRNKVSFPSFQEEIVSDMCQRFAKFINFNYDLYGFFYDSKDLKEVSKKVKEFLNKISIIRLDQKRGNKTLGCVFVKKHKILCFL